MVNVDIMVCNKDRHAELGLLLQSLRTQSFQNWDVFVLDERDGELQEEIEAFNLRVVTSNTVMNNTQEKTDLARRLLELL